MNRLLFFYPSPYPFKNYSTLCHELRSTSPGVMTRPADRKRGKGMVIEMSRKDEAATAGGDDPLLSKVELPLRVVYYPLGFGVEITTNSPAILHAASESWGHLYRRHANQTLQLRIGVTDGGSSQCPPAPVFRAQRHLLSIVADAHNHAFCDVNAGFAFAWFNDGALHHPNYLRYHFLEAIALNLISTCCVTAIHAACVSYQGHGMLLCGESGAGKSTLAYACARNGWTFTSDDASYLQRDADRPCVIGNSHQLRFRPSARELFPELKGRSLTPRAEGKPSIEVPTAELPIFATSDEAHVHSIIFLKRQPSTIAALRALPSNSAFDYFSRTLYPVGEVAQRQAAILQRLSHAAVYELLYEDLEQAVDCLTRLARARP
jgi:hypothetical protein